MKKTKIFLYNFDTPKTIDHLCRILSYLILRINFIFFVHFQLYIYLLPIVAIEAVDSESSSIAIVSAANFVTAFPNKMKIRPTAA